MAELTWATQAQQDLYDIVDYISLDNPKAAIAVSKRVEASADQLRRFPRQGKPGRVEGTRELVVSQAPYLLIYTVEDNEIVIARVKHQAQQWPPVKQEEE